MKPPYSRKVAMNKSEIKRTTKETDISASLELNSLERAEVDTGVPFFDHMLMSMARHGRFCLKIKCSGDYEVDDHHTVEDAGICIGRVLKESLGDKAGIHRFGEALIPMDDALVMAAVDLSGRYFLDISGADFSGYVGRYSEELTLEFFRSLAVNAGINLHIRVLAGANRHHIHEAIFKAAGIAIYRAARPDDFLNGQVLSTKGTIE